MLAEKKKRSFVSRPSSSLCSRMLFSTKDSCIRGQNQRPSVVDAHRVAESSSQFLNLSLFEEACTKISSQSSFYYFVAHPQATRESRRRRFCGFVGRKERKRRRRVVSPSTPRKRGGGSLQNAKRSSCDATKGKKRASLSFFF